MKIKKTIMVLTLIVISFTAACSEEDANDVNGETDPAGDGEMSSMNLDLPSDLDTSTTKESDNGIFEISVTSNMDPLDINEIHSWIVHVDDANGTVVEGATIVVDGGMPQHNHGFPTEPQITEELGDGDYLLDGVKFSMVGWWELKLDISSGSDSDTVTFNIILK